jgi:hypothetical protein
MGLRGWVLAALVVCSGIVESIGCVGSDDTMMNPDASSMDATNGQDVAPGSYALSVTPASVVLDPGGMVSVTVQATRSSGFTDAIGLSLMVAPTGVTGTATIAQGTSVATLVISASSSVPQGSAAMATINGISTPNNVPSSVPIFIRVGHILLTADTTTTWTVPSDVTAATIASWGAGGGSGSGYGTTVGGLGAAGGFEQADFTFTPGQVLTVLVGTGGQGGMSNGLESQAGAGGGYSAVLAGSPDAGLDGGDYLIIAGAGGGGGGGYTSGGNANGGAGGGSSGVAAPGGGGGGTQDAGGTSAQPICASGPLRGAPGYAESAGVCGGGAAAGTPGGGAGGDQPSSGSAGGGGGAGYYGGGGSSSTYPYSGGGGGGGSSYAASSAMNATTTAGSGTTAPMTTHMYYGNGAGVGAVGTTASGTAGGPGRVVIYLK